MSEQKTFDASESNLDKLVYEYNHYSIPRHQRAYSWGKDEVDKFLDAIFSVHSSMEESKDF